MYMTITTKHDEWVPACGGKETPFTIRGRTLLYMWNKTNGEHAYYDVTRDIFLTQTEVDEIFNR